MKYIVIFFLFVFSWRTAASGCSFHSVDDAIKNAKNVLVVEKLYSGLRYSDFHTENVFTQNRQKVLEKKLSAWNYYKDSKNTIEFLVLESLRGEFVRGQTVQVYDSEELRKLYNTGNKYIVVLEDSGSKNVYDLASCFRIDLSVSFAKINFETFSHIEFDDLVGKIRANMGNKSK